MEKTKKKILILGADGTLGQALTNVFKNDKNYETATWNYEEVDLTDSENLKKKITDLWPDFIFNTIEYGSVDLCEEDEEEYQKARLLNEIFPEELAKICSTLQIVLVHYSTDYVFDGKRPVYKSDMGRAPSCCGNSCPGCQYMGQEYTIDFFEYREDDRPNPLSKYGKTKLAGEEEALRNNNQTYIIRSSRIFGESTKSVLEKNFFDLILEKAKVEKSLKVIDDETSKFTYAPDLALESKNIIEDDVADFGIYHVVNEGVAAWFQGAVELFKLAGVDVEVIPVESSDEFLQSAKHPTSSVLKVTKRKPLRYYQEALKDYLESLD